MIRIRWPRKLLPAFIAILLGAMAPEAWAQDSAGATTDTKVDRELERTKQRLELLTQARADLYVRRDPRAAIEKCKKILEIEPEDATARFYMDTAQRRLAVGGTTESRVSGLPSQKQIEAAVARTHASTAPVAATPAALPGPSSGPITRSGSGAVVINPEDRPGPRWAWLPRHLLRRGALAGLFVLFFAALALVVERVLRSRRPRKASGPGAERAYTAQPIEPHRAGREADSFEFLKSESHMQDDYPTGPGGDAPSELDVAPAPPVTAEAVSSSQPNSRPGEDSEISYWETGLASEPRPSTISPVTAAVSQTEEEELEYVPADKAFAGDRSDYPSLESGTDFDRGEDEIVVASAAPPGPRVRPTPPPPPIRLGESPDKREDSAGPIQMDLSASTAPPPLPPRELPPERPREIQRIDEAPAMLESEDPLAREAEGSAHADSATDPYAFPVDSLPEAAQATESEVRPAPVQGQNLPVNAEPLRLRVEEEFIPGAKAPSPDDSKPTLIVPLPEPPRAPERLIGISRAALENGANAIAPDPEHYEEILITAGKHGGPGHTIHLAGEEVTADSTMINSRARHKAIFHDQLARGVSAMERRHWKDAVKYLSIAHAMDPTDEYALRCLQEARGRREGDE
jgi:hypothetical protein